MQAILLCQERVAAMADRGREMTLKLFVAQKRRQIEETKQEADKTRAEMIRAESIEFPDSVLEI